MDYITAVDVWIQQGIEKGVDQTINRVINNMLLKGHPDQLIIEATEISVDRLAEAKTALQRS